MVTKQVCKGNNNIQVAGDLQVLEPGCNVEITIPEIKIPKISLNPENCTGTCVINSDIYINGKKIPAPPKSRHKVKSVEIVNNHIWVSGWYWNGNEWIKMSKLRFRMMRKN